MSGSILNPPSAAAEFTGERFMPGCSGEIAYEHWHRYAFARRFVGGKRVLDAACGEGYGSALLSTVASSTTTRVTPVSRRKARSCSSTQIRVLEWKVSRRTDLRL